jgi:hypothetical protein
MAGTATVLRPLTVCAKSRRSGIISLERTLYNLKQLKTPTREVPLAIQPVSSVHSAHLGAQGRIGQPVMSRFPTMGQGFSLVRFRCSPDCWAISNLIKVAMEVHDRGTSCPLHGSGTVRHFHIGLLVQEVVACTFLPLPYPLWSLLE